MNKPKIILATICLLAAAGGALALKARQTTGAIFKNGGYVEVVTQAECHAVGDNCKYLDGTIERQFYSWNGSTYNPAAHD